MNTERIKSFVLFTLVMMSFILTTRIWFNVSIEGLFNVSKVNNPLQEEIAYDKEELLKPGKLVVHAGGGHTLLFNNTEDKEYYSFVLNAAKDVLRDWLTNYDRYTSSSISIDQIKEIRNTDSVELIFRQPMDYDSIKGLLDADKNPWNNIKDINSLIIAPNEGKLYIVDEGRGSIFEYKSYQMPTVLNGVMAEIERKDSSSCIFLNEYSNEHEYGNFAVIPITAMSLPEFKVKKEPEADTKLTHDIMKFFDDYEDANISSTVDEYGRVTFTDREEETVVVDMEGTLEYYKYNVSLDKAKYASVKESIDIASRYVNKHFGFTYDFYLSGIVPRPQGGHTSYLLSFDYKYNGVPIITEVDTGSSAIEVEVLGHEVKRYKRNVRVIEEQSKTINIISSLEMLNIVWGKLNDYLSTTNSENIIMLNDIYLAYFERNESLIPVWVVDVKVEGQEKEISNKKYIIGAEEAGSEEVVILGVK